MSGSKNSYFNENTLEELIEEIEYVYRSDDRPWVIGYSGGKDSTTVVELVYKMLQGLPDWQRNKNVYIVSSDTRIENPLIKLYLSNLNESIGKSAKRDGLPIIERLLNQEWLHDDVLREIEDGRRDGGLLSRPTAAPSRPRARIELRSRAR